MKSERFIRLFISLFIDTLAYEARPITDKTGVT